MLLLLPCLPAAVILEKFKDKAAVVGKAAAEALDAMSRYSISLVDVAEVRRHIAIAWWMQPMEGCTVWPGGCSRVEVLQHQPGGCSRCETVRSCSCSS